MSRNNEEDTFNKLMSTPSSSDAKKSDLGSNMGTHENDNFEDLMEKYANRIGTIINEIPNFETFIKAALGPSFNKIRGAVDQLKHQEITKEQLVQSGIYVLGETFVLPFINYEKGKKIANSPDKSQELIIDQGHKIEQINKSYEEVNLKNEFEKPRETKPTQESSTTKIKIPSMLLSKASSLQKQPPILPQTTQKTENPFNSEPVVQKAAPSFIIDRMESSLEKPKISVPEKIESVAPKKETLSYIDAIKKVGNELEKVNLTPIQFAKLEEDEIKSVNVAANLPGTQVYDDFEKVREMIYDKQYDLAERRLKELKAVGQKRKNEFVINKSEEMITNMAIYKMIPELLNSAETTQNLEKSKEIYEKALNFVNVLRDPYYSEKVNKRISQINEKMAFSRMKKDIESQEEVKMKKLIKENLRRLGKTETMMKIEEIRKYCAARSEEEIIEILVEMIQNTEIYAKFFPESKKVLFDKDANKDLIFKKF